MFFAPLEMKSTALLGPPLPEEVWSRLSHLDEAFQWELFSTPDRLDPRGRRWTVVTRCRDSGLEQFAVSGQELGYALALAALQAESRGMLVGDPPPRAGRSVPKGAP